MKIHPYKGMAWHEKEHSTDGDYTWRSISGEYTFCLKREATMFKIHGFDTTLANYNRSF